MSTPTLDDLMKLVTQTKQKQTVLDKVAATGSQNQGWRPPGSNPNTLDYAMGKGNSPEQNRGLNQLYGSILNRAPGQTRIGAATVGLERGSELMDTIRAKEKAERMEGAATAVDGSQNQFTNASSVYTKKIAEEAVENNKSKMGTVTFNGEVWATDPSGKPAYKLGATEGQMGRNDANAVREAKAAEEVKLKNEEDMKKVSSAADYGAAIQTDIDRIREGIDGWTTDIAGAAGQYLPGTDAYDQRLRVDSLKAKLGLGKLKELRDAAASGASGMGQLTEKELDRLESAIQKIDMGGSAAAQETALRDIERYYQPAMDAYARVFGVDKLTGKKVLTYNPATGKIE